MKILVKAMPGAGVEKIEKLDENTFKVWVKEPPAKGLANRAIARALAIYFKVNIDSVILKSGFASRQKVFDVLK